MTSCAIHTLEISKFLQILNLQPQISNNFLDTRTNFFHSKSEQFSRQNTIPNLLLEASTHLIPIGTGTSLKSPFLMARNSRLLSFPAVEPEASDVLVYKLWQCVLSSFQVGGTKLEIFLPKNQYTHRKLLNFENQCSNELSKIGHHFRNKVI